MPPHACVIMTQSSSSLNPEVPVAAQPYPPPPLPPPAKKLKQGISSILVSENDDQGASSAPSIRRTLSADMSSKKWASQTGLVIDEERRSSSVSDRPGQDEVWRAIQEQRLHQGNDDLEQGPPKTITRAAALPSASSTESFSSILDSSLRKDVFGPYIPPLQKKPPKKLSAKSLLMCTEILGSETGADDFQPDLPPLPTNRKKPPLMNMYMKRSPARPLPPPLPSLDMNKTTVQVRTRREDGRLILEAVSVPPREYLRAERNNGRLFISLINSGSSNEQRQKEEPEFVFNFEETEVRNGEDEEEDDDGDKEEQGDDRNRMGIAAEQDSSFPGRRYPPPMRFPGLIFKKNRALMEDLIINQAHSQSLPPAPGVAGMVRENPPVISVTFVNDYDYFWRRKPAIESNAVEAEHLIQKLNNDNNNDQFVSMEEQRKRGRLGLLRGSTDKKMPPAMLNGCKDGRRSLLHRPNLIAGRSN
ncbi:unnamed protein product [Cuscuta europaea]|uniref:FAF domain-containing protein n=1 Tax=Cuscuta europaea TaxID=41803 RepID=A0A9P0YRH0_CUSEU|nr:unnamed protein product [Cuscuta europaea]